VNAVYARAIDTMAGAGAIIVDPADLPAAQEIASSPDELTVLLFEFKQDLNRYLVQRGDPATIARYQQALEHDRHPGREQGTDAVLQKFNLDALVAPTNPLPWKIDLLDGDHDLGGSSTPTSLAGYPALNVPAGFSFGLPIGLTFMGTAWSEPILLKLACGFEAATQARKPPTFLPASTLI
jgi:amidase